MAKRTFSLTQNIDGATVKVVGRICFGVESMQAGFPVQFGPYLLLERVSVGGMAEVFKAKTFGVAGFERILAIKRILPDLAEDEEFVKMFIDEARIVVQLSHPNIAQISELGKQGDNFYIAMEYIPSRDLRTVLDDLQVKNTMMSLEQAVYIVSKICEGLHFAHNKRSADGKPLNIVHRDISPQNILVSYQGEVKVIDFGIAKAADRASKTQAGVLKGKFGYMSPEQVRGAPVDHRSDIFALGILFYELVTNFRLFVVDSDFATLENIRDAKVPSPRKKNPNISKELERVMLKALARNVDKRYQSAEELAEDLQQFLIYGAKIFGSKDLSGFMNEKYSKEILVEQRSLEKYMRMTAEQMIVETSSTTPAPVPGLHIGEADQTEQTQIIEAFHDSESGQLLNVKPEARPLAIPIPSSKQARASSLPPPRKKASMSDIFGAPPEHITPLQAVVSQGAEEYIDDDDSTIVSARNPFLEDPSEEDAGVTRQSMTAEVVSTPAQGPITEAQEIVANGLDRLTESDIARGELSSQSNFPKSSFAAEQMQVPPREPPAEVFPPLGMSGMIRPAAEIRPALAKAKAAQETAFLKAVKEISNSAPVAAVVNQQQPMSMEHSRSQGINPAQVEPSDSGAMTLMEQVKSRKMPAGLVKRLPQTLQGFTDKSLFYSFVGAFAVFISLFLFFLIFMMGPSDAQLTLMGEKSITGDLEIYIDGELRGTVLPVDLEVESEMIHQIKVMKKGYIDWSSAAPQMQSGQVLKLLVELKENAAIKKAAKGTKKQEVVVDKDLDVAKDTDFKIDQVLEKTKIEKKEVDPVETVKPHATTKNDANAENNTIQSSSKQKTVTSANKQHVSKKKTKIMVKVGIISRPRMTVYIDKKRIGKTPLMASKKVSLKPGQHYMQMVDPQNNRKYQFKFSLELTKKGGKVIFNPSKQLLIGSGGIRIQQIGK